MLANDVLETSTVSITAEQSASSVVRIDHEQEGSSLGSSSKYPLVTLVLTTGQSLAIVHQENTKLL